MPQEDTIVAIATPLGMGGVGVVRMSGPQALFIVKSLIDNPPKMIRPRYLHHGWIKDTDEVLFAYMPAPKSYTGEDVVEVNCHGGPAVLQKILKLCIGSGARQAKPGEFTKRAYLNGRIDLTQAEAVLEIVRSKTEEAAVVAVGQVGGKLKHEMEGLKKQMIAMLAELEAAIDFPDDVASDTRQRMVERIGEMSQFMERLIGEAKRGEVLRGGVSVAITGRPNVGKSSLLNYLAGHERAIVTDVPGTTRDTIEETIDVDGMPVRVIDTAGLRRPRGRAEGVGVRKAREKARQADLILMMVDASRKTLSPDEKGWLKEHSRKAVLMVKNKVDLGDKMKADGIPISVKTGAGIDELLGKIRDEIMSKKGLNEGTALMLNARQLGCLKSARKALQRAMDSIKIGSEDAVIAIEIKEAIVAISEMTGEAIAEEVIEKIFDEFCIGK